ncbi:MAG: matrixin family metalloprotease [Pseudomonadota bacterium]
MCVVCMMVDAENGAGQTTATPDQSTAIHDSFDSNIQTLTGNDMAYRWNVAADVGAEVVVTYNFPSSPASYLDSNDRAGYQGFDTTQQALAIQALDEWAAISGLTFVEVPEDEQAEITFQFIDMDPGTAGYAYYPFVGSWGGMDYIIPGDVGGDIFMSDTYDYYGGLNVGGWAYATLLHEIGHAIGLKHPFSGTPTLSSGLDNSLTTVMSYNWNIIPTDLGWLDVAAAQALYGSSSAVSAYWDDASDRLVQQTGNGGGSLFGQSVDSYMEGGNGNDNFYNPFGNDTVVGGNGDDTVYVDTWFIRNDVIANGDVLLLDYRGETITLTGIENFVFSNNTYTRQELLPSVGYTGTTGNDIRYGNQGIDTMLGENGNDTLYGGNSGDNITGGRGHDYLDGQNDDDEIRGNNGDDTMFGGDGLDSLYGGTGEDSMTGGEDNDVMRGQRNGDFMDGGDGNDNVKGGGGNDTIYGGAGDDFLKGGTRVDVIYGGAGNDTINANSFDDTLDGGTGNDSLNAGGGNDRLDGGDGNDTLKGGGNNDVFVFQGVSASDDDRFLDFTIGQDRLELEQDLLGGQTLDQFFAGKAGSFSATGILNFDNGSSITFVGLNDLNALAGSIDLI